MKTDEMVELTLKDVGGEIMDVEELLGLLEQLEVGEHNYRLLALLPLVFVAWADGTIQRAERRKILEVAESHHFINEGSKDLLERWLHHEPTPLYYDFGLRALVQLARRHRGIGADLSSRDLAELVQLSVDVGHAAGLLWNHTKPMTTEQQIACGVVAELLSIDEGETWQELIEDLSLPVREEDVARGA